MPDVAVHAAFGREVRAELGKETAEKIREVPYTFALFGPDIWFMYQPEGGCIPPGQGSS